MKIRTNPVRATVAVGSTLILLAMSIAACGGGRAPADQGAVPQVQQPVMLTFFTEGNSVVLAEQIEQLVKEKFPHITLKTIKHGKGTTIEDTLNAGITPDLISYSLGGLWKVKELQLASDLTPFLQKYKFDLNRLASGVIETVKSYSDKGEFLVMPFELNNNVLFYNKNIFNKFGVPFPYDGMTWEQVNELAKKVTRTDNGVQYKGFQYNGLNLVYKNQMGLTFVDPKTMKATVNNDRWKKWMETMSSFYRISGNEVSGDEKENFLKNQTLAMRTGPNFLTELPAAVEKGLDWDVVALPKFAGMESAGSQMNAPYYTIPPTSNNKDQAFQVIAYLLSDEVQTVMAKQGRIPIVKSEHVIQAFGSGLEVLKGKNLSAFFKDNIAQSIPPTKFDGFAKEGLTNVALAQVNTGTKDINTALREAEEQINLKIAEQNK